MKVRLLLLIFLLFTVSSAVKAQAALPPSWQLIETVVLDKYAKEGGDPKQVWGQPWRFVFLFNSSHAEGKSAITNAAIETIRNFLSARLNDGQPHELWFYPYQLDIYTGADQSIAGALLSRNSLDHLERVFPKVKYKTLGDNVTPYPDRGGHNNIAARRAVSEIIGRSDKPTLLVQITDVIISEAPGTPNDALVRQSDRVTEGAEAAGLVAYPSPVTTLTAGVNNETYNLLIYGSPELYHADNPLSSASSGTWGQIGEDARTTWQIVAIVLAAISLGALAYWSIMTTRSIKWSVTLKNSAAVVLVRGESVGVYGPDAKHQTHQQVVTLREDNVPPEKLFELLWDKKGVQLRSALWRVSASRTENTMLHVEDSVIVCVDTTDQSTRRINVKVNRI